MYISVGGTRLALFIKRSTSTLTGFGISRPNTSQSSSQTHWRMAQS
jgi:hypothetical protein